MKFRRTSLQFALNLASEGYSQAVTASIQLLLLPTMLWIWGAERYGSWLIIAALPTYLSLLDLGFAKVSANDMTMLMANGDLTRARAVNQTAWLMNGAMALVAVAGTAILVTLVPIGSLFRIDVGDPGGISMALILLGTISAISIVMGAVGAAMRAVGLYSLLVASNATARALEAVALFLTAILGGNFAAAAAAMLGVRILVMGGVTLVFYRNHSALAPGISEVDSEYLKSTLGPSIAHISYTASNLINIQGTTLLAGALLGPVAVVSVNATRALARLGKLASAAVTYALEPIFSHLSGTDDRNSAARVYGRLLVATAGGLFVYLVGMVLWGNQVLVWWTHGAVSNQQPLLLLMAVGVGLEIVWTSVQTPFVATNRHTVFAPWFFLFSVAGACAVWPALALLGAEGAGWASILVQGGTLVTTISLATQHGFPIQTNLRRAPGAHATP